MENTIRVNPLKYPNVKCHCGCEVWNQGVILKRIPGLEMGQGTEDVFVDLPVSSSKNGAAHHACNYEYKNRYKTFFHIILPFFSQILSVFMFLHMYCLMLFLTLPALSFDACVQFIIP